MAYGAVLSGHLLTAPHNAQIRRYVITSADGTATFIGDFVKTEGTIGSATVAGESLGAVIQAAAGDTIRGVVMGFDPILGVAIGSENLNRLYRPASTQMVAMVCDDYNAIFKIQSNASIAITKIGENADIVVGTGSTTTGMSNMSVSATTSTATAQLRLLAFDAAPNNVPAAATADVLVLINEHELKSTTGV